MKVAAVGGLGTALAGLSAWLASDPARAADAVNASALPAMKGPAPTIFIGHGSPMNVVRETAWSRRVQAWGRELGRPRAILMVSAHWLTRDTLQVSTTAQPELIHDFGGFPKALHEQRYPAPGAPEPARRSAAALAPRPVGIDASRGLDHGAWTVLKHLYPAADVPVFQLSIDITQAGPYQLAVGRRLAALRAEGVLIVGSGNIVHNLRAVMVDQTESPRGQTDWADGFDQSVRAALDAGDTTALSDYQRLGPQARAAVPFPDHYHPMLVALGAAQTGERVRHVFEGFQEGTLSMRCLQWG
ncbi:4,5-DOPA-extradiol-dioxygenase [Leptothrix sp. BB-4]